MDNRQVFLTFIEQNLDSAYRFAYTYMKEEAAAEDVVSDSVVKALKSIHTLKNPQFVKSWFFRIIINTALTQLKKNAKNPSLDLEQFSNTIPVFDNYDKLTLHDVLHKLSRKYRDVVVLRFFENMSLEEIAAATGENLNTTKTRLYRALKMMRAELEEISV